MAKKAATLRVHQLSKELGVDSKDIVAKCMAEEIPSIENHMSIVSAGLAATIREWFSEGHLSASGQGTAVETTAVVDIAKAKARARKRSTGKKGADGADAGSAQDAATGTALAEPTEAMESASSPAPEPESRMHVETPKAPAVPPATDEPASAGEPAASEKPTAAGGPGDAPLKAKPAPWREPVAPAASAPPAAPARPARPQTPVPAPVMNVPKRPETIKPVGPMLSQPKRVEMKGPKIVRVETPDVLPAPRSRSAPSGPVSRGGPRAGRGVGGGPAESMDASRGRGGKPGAPASRRNERRSASAMDDSGRTGKGGLGGAEAQSGRFDWREQDLLERENKLNRATGFFRKARRDNIIRSAGGGHRAVSAAEAGGRVKVQTPISIKDLSAATGVKVGDIVRKLFMTGKTVNANSVLDADAAIEAVLDYNIELEIDEQKTAEQKIAQQFKKREATDERRRSPVVTILGHVDHGKTSLLDRIRDANVAAGEAGGITQATSAFQVPVKVGQETRQVTFIDTPGHEAFTEMRSRGAKVTDVVVLVVAADDGVMPQTIESINHARAAGVPIVVALNKVDKPEATDANIQRILGQLANHELNPTEWGGQTEVVRTSATKGQGVTELLEVLDYQAQLLDLKADFGGEAEGSVLEASVKEGRGAVANVIVQQGTLKKGDFIVVGRAFGRVRDITTDRGQRVEQAAPSMPVAFSGINEIPDAGDKFYVVKSLQEAEEAALERQAIERQQALAREKVTLDNVFAKLEATGKKELPLIVKADVQGSVETLRATLGKISGDEISVSIKHCAVGGVNESDVSLAETTGAIVLAFNVTASAAARKAADAKGVDIRFYDVIYDLTDDVKAAAEGMLEPELKLEVLGHAEVRDVFKISKVGNVAGCYVTDGVIERNAQIRVTRGGIVIEKDRRLQQLKRFKDDAKEVRAGQECGMNIDGYDDIKPGDILECYKTKEVRRKL